jgi:predicted nucleic acid-binding protein
VGLAEVSRILRRHRRIAIDTNIFIYQLEAHPQYSSLTQKVFDWVEYSGHRAVTSTITQGPSNTFRSSSFLTFGQSRTGLLVLPYREQGIGMADRLYALLTLYPNLEWVPPSLAIVDVAAKVRAAHGLRTPDALQAAAAIDTRSTAFVSNDPAFDRVPEFETLLLDRLL